MHVQVVTYRIAGITESEFIDANKEFATMMAEVPGLLAKVWLKGGNDDVYGGAYLWQDRAACEAFLSGELWASAIADDTLLDLATADYGVMESLTSATQPGLKVL